MHIPHLLAELYDCCSDIEDPALLMQAAEAAAAKVGATVVNTSRTIYQPHGATVAVVLAESHILLTTWPEHRMMLFDAILCNPEMDPHAALAEIRARFCPDGTVVTHQVCRVIAPGPD